MVDLNKIVSEEKRRLNQIKENEANIETRRIARENSERAESQVKSEAESIVMQEKASAFVLALTVPVVLFLVNMILSGVLRMFLSLSGS